MEMIIAKVVKDFGTAKTKDGKRKYGFSPVVGSRRRFRKDDFELLKKDGLVRAEGKKKPLKSIPTE